MKSILRYSATSPYDALLQRTAWSYYQLNGSFDNGCNRVKRPAASPFEGTIPNVSHKNKSI